MKKVIMKEVIMKKVYVVRGSEDGNIAVYSNAVRAVKHAMEYVCCEGLYSCSQTQTELMASLKKYWHCQADNGGDFALCEVESFYLEK